MRPLAWAGIGLGALLLVASLVLGIVGIWTVGPNAGRYGATAFLAFLVGGVLEVIGAMWLDSNPRSDR